MITILSVLLSLSLAMPLPASQQISLNMLLLEQSENGSMSRASGIGYHGQCRQYQADCFQKCALGYQMEAYPGVELFLPVEHVEEEFSGRPIGICWNMPDASTGNAFEEKAHFDYDRELPEEENRQNALEFLSQVKAGDILQLLAVFNNGSRGTHTFMVTRDYDSRTGTLYWSDSNFSNKRIDGLRYGIVKAYQKWNIEDVAKWISSGGNTGATIYRIREDVVRVGE